MLDWMDIRKRALDTFGARLYSTPRDEVIEAFFEELVKAVDNEFDRVNFYLETTTK